MGVSPDQLPTIEAALRSTGIWVSPGLAGRLTATDRADITAGIKALGTPAYVVVADVDLDDPDFPGGMSTLLQQLHDDLHVDGAYLGTTPSYEGRYETEIQAYPKNYDVEQSSFPAEDAAPKDLAKQIETALSWIHKGGATGYLSARTAKDNAPSSTGTRSPSDAGGSDSGGGLSTTVGISALLVLAIVAAVIVRLVRSRRGPSQGFRPSKAVLANVRAAEDRDWASRAQTAVLTLGEAIDAATMPAAPTGAWQAALDHYDAARRVLDRPRHPSADDIGALILADRGSAALTAAKAGRDWSPVTTCYFNPLHGVSQRRVTWQTVAVPACRACAKAIDAGDEPRDVLDLVADGVPRHYFQLDVQPWARTGYGALDSDLVGALLTD